jgi:hypothetical protein
MSYHFSHRYFYCGYWWSTWPGTYLTEKQMPCNYWFIAIIHAAWMMNAIPGKVRDRVALLFFLVHGIGHDEWTWIPLFSLCYFHHEKDGNDTRSKHMAHMMDGVIVGRSLTSDALMVFNPQNSQYYELDSYRIDPYRLLAWSILRSNMTGGVSSVCCYKTIIQPLKRSILPERGLNGLIHPQISSLRGRSWIFPSQFLLPKLTCCSLTPSSSTMAPLLLYH